MEPQKKVTWKDLRIGLLALFSFVILIITVIMMGEGQFKFMQENIRYRTFLPEADGLKAGSEVWLAGVEVGEVVSVRFADPDDTLALEAIEVGLEVEMQYQRRIRNDSVASLRTIGLLGDKYVEISPGSAGEPVLEPNGVITGISLSTFDELVGVGRNTARGFNELMVELRRLALDINNKSGSMGKLIHDDEFYNNLNDIVSQTTALIRKAEQGGGTLGRIMADSTLYYDLVRSSAATRRTVASVDSTLKVVNTMLIKLQTPGSTVNRLTTDDALYLQMEATLARIDTLVQNVEQGQGTLGRLTQNETVIQETEGLIMDMRALIKDFRENPKKYVKVSVF